MKSVTECADLLHDIQNSLRLLESQEAQVKTELAAAMIREDVDTAIGSCGQTYKIAYPPARYLFSVPEAELSRLGILADCTPPPPAPKLTKTKLDDLLKKRRLDETTVASWCEQGWYEVERSGEITVKQVETKLETLQKVMKS